MDVAKLIPNFDGKGITAKQFEKEYKTAEAFVSITERQFFFRIVKSKIIGDAQVKLQFCELESRSELFNELKRIYSAPENLAQIQSELARIVQGKNEKVNDYGWRVKGILHKAIESIKDDFEKTAAEGMIIGIKKVALNCFLIGLKPEITVLIGFQNLSSLEEATSEASEHEKIIEIQKGLHKNNDETEKPKRKMKCYNIETENEKRRAGNQKEIICYRCQKRGHMSRYCTASMQEIRSQKNDEGDKKNRCYYCNMKGHLARDCRKKQGEERKRERKNMRGKVEYSCNYCKRDGYSYKYCRKRKYYQEQCAYCGAKGHSIDICKRKEEDQEKGKEEKPKRANLNMK